MKTSLIFICLSLFSLKADLSLKENDFIGYWIFSHPDASYIKQSSFDVHEPGIRFMKSGKLEKRQNVGWCGTEPVTYGNFNGSWEIVNDSVIQLNYEFWGGEIRETWKIKTITGKQLIHENLTYDVIKKGKN